MIAYIKVQPTAIPERFRVDLENHTDSLRISEIYTRNTGMDGDRKPDYKSEHEIIAQILAGITTIKGIISQAKVASRRYDEDLNDYLVPTGWTTGWVASFKLYNQIFNYLGFEHKETSEEGQEISEPPVKVESNKVSDPISDTALEPGKLLLIPPDIGVDAEPWGVWVRDTGAGAFEPAKHLGKLVYFFGKDGSAGPISNLDLAYKFKNINENPNLLNSCPRIFDELRAELGVSYYFEKENEVSE